MRIFLAVLKWMLFLPLDIGFGIIAKLLNPVVVLFATEEGYLPWWLSYFETTDNSLDGDSGWVENHLWFGDKGRAYGGGIKRYINRVRWLMRNTGMGFSEKVLGGIAMQDMLYTATGDEATGNRPLHNGWVFRTITNANGKGTYWCFYYVKSWNSTMCIRILLGWKIWQYPIVGKKLQFTLNFNPFMGWSNVA
jgi:hypothetical protein